MDPSPSSDPRASEAGPSSTDHLDLIEVEPEPGAEDPGAGAPGIRDGFISPEAFLKGFGLSFAMVGELTGLETLKAVPTNPTTAPAAQALYDTCREVPWLNWLVRPESKWMQRSLALGAFAVPLALGCQVELKRRGAAASTPVGDPGASGTAKAPSAAKEPPPADMAPLAA